MEKAELLKTLELYGETMRRVGEVEAEQPGGRAVAREEAARLYKEIAATLDELFGEEK